MSGRSLLDALLDGRARGGAEGSAEGEFSLPGAEAHYPPDLGIEPVHLDIAARVDIEAQAVQLVVTHTLCWRRDDARRLRLDGVELIGLELRDLEGHELRWRYDGASIEVLWAEPAARGETRRIELRYRVERPASGILFSSPSPQRPMAPRFAATDHETERARHWLATVDLPAVRPTLAFHLRAPAELTVLANGVRSGEERHDDGTKTVHWRLEQPCPSYLTSFVVGELVRLDDGAVDGVELAYFCTPEHDVGHLSRSFGGTADMMRWITAKLGSAFPFPKYYQVALPDIGGAMENISLVSWDDQFLLDETLAGELGRLVDQINIHEMAHSWFGDLVVCRDYAHAWLKESWATYIESCWFEEVHGRDEQLYELWLSAETYLREADTRYQRPLVTRRFHSSFEMYDYHLYPGGAMRLHTLRGVLGDELFWQGVRSYLSEYAGSVVETDDFRRVLERVSGRSLVEFFEQWFYSPGYPALEVEFDYDQSAARGTFTVRQTQVDAKAGIGCFRLELALAWTIDGETQQRRVELDGERHSFGFAMDQDPEMVRVDPDFEVLHKLSFDPGRDKLSTQLAEAPDVVGRILAGRELAKQGRPQAVAKIGERWPLEPFWGVRVAWAQALANSATPAAVAVLRRAVAEEQDHRVLAGLLRACVDLRDPQLSAAVQRRLAAGLPPLATAAAWELLGSQREAAPLAELEAAAGRPGYNGVAPSGALRGLAASRQLRALDLLLAATQPGEGPARTRPSAARALGELARGLDKRPRERAVERLTDLLRDPIASVRLAAVAGLEAAGASEAQGALERFRRQLTQQEAVRVDRVLAKLRRRPQPRLSAAEKELEELRDKLRKLEARLDKLDGKGDRDRESDCDGDGDENGQDSRGP